MQISDLVWWTPLILKVIFILKVIEELQTAPVNHEEKELLQLLSTPHLRVKTHQRPESDQMFSVWRNYIAQSLTERKNLLQAVVLFHCDFLQRL